MEICGAGNGFQVFDVDGQSYPCHILSPLVLEGEKLQKIKDDRLYPKLKTFQILDAQRVHMYHLVRHASPAIIYTVGLFKIEI